jgi:DNA-binding MarR family transcriptional regulator
VIDRPHLDLSEYLPYLINRIGSALVERMQEELSPHGLSIAMWRVLAVLSDIDKQRQIDIAEMTAIDVSTMSRLISRLIKMGLVSRVRSDTNNREVIVELTAKGRTLVNRLIPTARTMERAAVAGLSAADLAITRDCLRQMYFNIAPQQEKGAVPQKPVPAQRRKAG